MDNEQKERFKELCEIVVVEDDPDTVEQMSAEIAQLLEANMQQVKITHTIKRTSPPN
jgi:hypothetical protein